MSKSKRVWDIEIVSNIVKNEVCLVCSGLDNIGELREKIEKLGLETLVVKRSVINEVIGSKLGGSVLLVYGSRLLILEDKLKKFSNLLIIHRIIDGVCVGNNEKIELGSAGVVTNILSLKIMMVLKGITGLNNKIVKLIEYGNNKSVN